MVGHFGVPFIFLMSRHIKRARATLAVAAVYILVLHWIDLHWVIMPSLHHDGMHLSWLDFAPLVGMSALFLGVFVGMLRKTPVIPVRDPRLRESLDFVNQ